MFMIRQHKSSIYLTELLIVLLEFTLVDKSTSNQKICGNNNTQSISYTQVGNAPVEWNEAWRLCNNNGSTLPVICNQHEQDALINFIKANIESSNAVWTSGKRILFNEWKWIDGQTFDNRGVIEVRHESYTHAYLSYDRTYSALNPSGRGYYLCHYSDSSCNFEIDIRVTNGCVRPSNYDRPWFDARSQCIANGGDLALLTDDDLRTLRRSNKLTPWRSYWIGLRKNAWYWSLRTTVPSDVADEEFTFANYWSSIAHSLADNCMSIDARNGEWMPDRCTTRRTVICQTSTTSRTVLSTSEGATTNAETADFHISEAELLASVARESSSVSYATFATILVVALCIIVISNIIVALVVRKYIYQKATASSNSAKTETTRYQDLESIKRQANPDGTYMYTELQLQPDYEEVTQRGH